MGIHSVHYLSASMSVTYSAPDALLTRTAAASLLGIAPKTLANLATKGGGPPIIYVGPRSPRYSLSDLRTWKDARRVANTSEGDAKGLTARGSAFTRSLTR